MLCYVARARLLMIKLINQINQVLCCAHLPPTVYSLAILVLVNTHISKAAAASSLEPLIWNHTLRNTNIYMLAYAAKKSPRIKKKNMKLLKGVTVCF